MTLENPFIPCAGSVTGREHARCFKGSQDGWALGQADGLIAAVVTDGCSSGARSEVGARFAATWLARWLPIHAKAGEGWAERACAGLLDALREIAARLSPRPEDVPATVHDFLLFSVLAVVAGEERVTILGAGDGVFAVDGTRTALDPGPDNAPAYLAYALLDGDATRARVLFDAPASEVSWVAVATDGALEMDLSELADARYVKNASLLQKRLVVLGEVERRLRDDTTVALLARKETT